MRADVLNPTPGPTTQECPFDRSHVFKRITARQPFWALEICISYMAQSSSSAEPVPAKTSKSMGERATFSRLCAQQHGPGHQKTFCGSSPYEYAMRRGTATRDPHPSESLRGTAVDLLRPGLSFQREQSRPRKDGDCSEETAGEFAPSPVQEA